MLDITTLALARKYCSGEGLPEGATAYQQLVTDGDGNAKWEDRLAYTEQSYAVVYDIASSQSLYVNGTDSAFIKDGISYVGITDLKPPTSLYELKVEDRCRINYDDDVYECVVRTHQEEMFNLGNQKFFGGEDTGEPFYIMWGMVDPEIGVIGEYNGHNVSSSTYNLHGLKIEMVSETIVPIDPKWLPVVDSVTLNSSTNGSSKKFKITVDDNGTISATEVT